LILFIIINNFRAFILYPEHFWDITSERKVPLPASPASIDSNPVFWYVSS